MFGVNHGAFWRDESPEILRFAWGDLWWLVLLLIVGGTAYGIWRVRPALERLVGVATSDGDLEVDAAIVCNGATSTLAPAARPGRTLNAIMGWYEGVEGISDAVELYFDPVVKPYYGWLFPDYIDAQNEGSELIDLNR